MAEDSEYIFKWNHNLCDIASKMHYLLDATLISAEGESIKVHRLMLCVSRKLFEVSTLNFGEAFNFVNYIYIYILYQDKFIQHPSV